jgi:hypothetical protein
VGVDFVLHEMIRGPVRWFSIINIQHLKQLAQKASCGTLCDPDAYHSPAAFALEGDRTPLLGR